MKRSPYSMTMNRREWLATGGAALAAAVLSPGIQASEKNISQEKSTLPNIIVFLSDALRADHLGCYGYPVPTSPRIDAFAQQSMLFEQCHSQAPWTKPSVSSLYTGVLPPVHQSVVTSFEQESFWEWDDANPHGFEIQTLREDFTTLAEALKKQGYHTAAFQYTPHCQKEFGFARGFDYYRYVPVEAIEPQTDALIKWIREEAQEPFFIYVHEIDPHGPYIPRERFYEALFDLPSEKAKEKLSPADREIIDHFQMPGLLDLSPRGLDYLISLYDAEIRGMDFQFGRVLDCLSEKNIDDHTMVALISDHGEAFGEHGFFKHNNSLYHEELHVPLIMGMGGKSKARKVPWTVNLYDLYPSLLTLAGAEIPSYVQATSLLDAQGMVAIEADLPVYAYFDHNRPDISTWECCFIENDLKVYDKGDGSPLEIYHRKDDPGEKHNLYGSLPNAKELQERLQKIKTEHQELSLRFGAPQYAGIDMKSMEELRALGYF